MKMEKKISELIPISQAEVYSEDSFDITDLSLKELEYAREQIKKENRRYRFFKSTKEIELSEEEEERAIKLAIRNRYERSYWQRVMTPEIVVDYTAEDYWKMYQADLKRMGFSIEPHQKEVMSFLCLYFSRDERMYDYKFSYGDSIQQNFSFDKGIILIGDIGCSKTSMLRFFSQIIPDKFMVLSSLKIAKRFEEEGKGIKDYYSSGYYCFDDLATEDEKKFFGNNSNVLGEILWYRHEKNIKTHATSNLNWVKLGEFYGERMKSRLLEIFNFIGFPDNSPDLRILNFKK